MKSERLELLWHHGDMLGFIKSVGRKPSLYLGDKYDGMENLPIEEAVEIYMKEVIDSNPYYRTGNPEVRERYKKGVLHAVLASENGIKIEYVPNSTPSGDIICQGCYQFELDQPDFPGCVRKKRR